jgi:biotin carboxyl carrier protein
MEENMKSNKLILRWVIVVCIVASVLPIAYIQAAPKEKLNKTSVTVEVGKTVSVGQIVCIIEAMKLMNEIESDVSGKIVEICVRDGQPVEYGQVLMVVEP